MPLLAWRASSTRAGRPSRTCATRRGQRPRSDHPQLAAAEEAGRAEDERRAERREDEDRRPVDSHVAGGECLDDAQVRVPTYDVRVEQGRILVYREPRRIGTR